MKRRSSCATRDFSFAINCGGSFGNLLSYSHTDEDIDSVNTCMHGASELWLTDVPNQRISNQKRGFLVLKSSLKIAAFFLIFATGQLAADSHPVHFMACNFMDGKGTEDMMKYVEKWNEAMGDAKGYEAYIMTPTFTSGPNTPDFIWAGTWESMTSMGAGWDAYTANEELASIDNEDWPATCEINTLWSSTQVREG